VDDLIDAMTGLMEYEGPDAHQPVNAGSTDERSMNEVVEEIGRILGRRLDVVYHERPGDDPERRKPDCTRAQKMLNWRPRVPLAEGLRKTIEYFRTAR
jgi:nucleoside-diphosphate-sugar epimerase